MPQRYRNNIPGLLRSISAKVSIKERRDLQLNENGKNRLERHIQRKKFGASKALLCYFIETLPQNYTEKSVINSNDDIMIIIIRYLTDQCWKNSL